MVSKHNNVAKHDKNFNFNCICLSSENWINDTIKVQIFLLEIFLANLIFAFDGIEHCVKCPNLEFFRCPFSLPQATFTCTKPTV